MARTFEINKENWPCGVSDGLSSPCAKCGKEKIRIDYVITDEMWENLVPSEHRLKVICLECLEILAAFNGKLSEFYHSFLSLQFTGKAGTVEFLPANIFIFKEPIND